MEPAPALASGTASAIVRREMATSDEDKNKDEDEDRDDVDEGAGEGNEPGEGGDEDGGDEDGGDEGEEEAPAAKKPAAKEPPAKAAKAAAGKAPATGKSSAAKAVEAPRPPPSAGLGKSVSLFVVVVGGLSLLMLLLGSERGGGPAQAPKWNEGQTVDVDITLVKTDRSDLACASGTEVKGLHCGYETTQKRWSKGDPNDDKKTLRPYSTVTSVNMLAAGVWSEPVLAPDKLPDSRFSIKCKFTIAGKMPRADVRWHEGEGWNNVTEWYTGTVSDCKMGTIQN
jgi:hypothetical protein